MRLHGSTSEFMLKDSTNTGFLFPSLIGDG